jgi:creatinine amidohydrolase
MNFIRYEESRPGAMRAMIRESPVAYVPFGSLEWHGEHAPLGVDGLKAHALCEAAAERTGGVVFPTIYWGAFHTMPLPFTFHFKKSGIRYLAREILKQLAQWNFKAIVLLTGHYPGSQVRLLRKECRRFNRAGGALALGVPEQAFALDIEYYGDHAGMWETSFMMAIRPDLVDLSAMPVGLPTLERLAKFGVMGQDPISKASAEEGRHTSRNGSLRS